jgi:hypothetical protein
MTHDTAGDEAPAGPARQLAAAITPLLSATATFKLHPDGQVSDVRLEENVGEPNDAKSPAAEAFSRFLTREGALELSGAAHLALPPQPVSQGARWNRQSDVQTAAGLFQRTNTYELIGEEDRDGRRLAKIEFTATLAPRDEDPKPLLPGEPERPPAARIDQQSGKGAIFFDVAQGYPVEATVEQQLTFVSPSGTQKVRQQAASELKIRISKIPPNAGGEP